MRFLLKLSLILIVFGGVYLSGKTVWELRRQPVNNDLGGVIIDIRPRESFNSVLAKLNKYNIIKNELAVKIYARLLGYTKSIRVGEYQISGDMSIDEILSLFTSGKSFEYKVTFQEGLNMYEVAHILAKKGLVSYTNFLSLCKDQNFIHELLGQKLYSLEGYLFPETYHFSKYTGAKSIIKTMVRNFLNNYKAVKVLPRGMSRHDLVILASIIEKETGAPEERPIISAVFHNRLKKPMRLETDPTILYGILDKTGTMKKNITRKDIKTYTPYNTYRMMGLPKGPIANAGREALLAAANPALSEYFYFVSRNDGTHVFSRTYKQHLKAVRIYQLNRKARQGKSWRDLKKRKNKNN